MSAVSNFPGEESGGSGAENAESDEDAYDDKNNLECAAAAFVAGATAVGAIGGAGAGSVAPHLAQNCAPGLRVAPQELQKAMDHLEHTITERGNCCKGKRIDELSNLRIFEFKFASVRALT